MKKLFLLFVAGVAGMSAFAQKANNLVSVPQNNFKAVMQNKQRPTGGLHKTTATGSYWYSFQEVNFTSSSSSGILPIYNDTSLYVPGGSPSPFFWYIQGLGTSFDPTSAAFLPGNVANPDVELPTFSITNSNAYTVDSIEIVGYYNRLSYNNYVDTLNIYVAIAPATGATTLTLKDPYCFDNLGIPDSTLRLADMVYDSVTNSILSSQVPGVIKIQKILDAAAYADSTASGLHDWSFRLPSTLNVPAGGKIVAYQQYVSGNAYPFQTNLDSANTWWVLSYELLGASSFPQQRLKDLNCGLIQTSAGRYDVGGQATIVSGKQYLNCTYLYGAAARFDDPWFAFHISCPTCVAFDVKQVAQNVSDVKAYPNPASEELNISFSLSTKTDATVSIVNMLGQSVATQTVANGKATFNTKSLPAGLYVYTIESNGVRTNGHVVIAH